MKATFTRQCWHQNQKGHSIVFSKVLLLFIAVHADFIWKSNAQARCVTQWKRCSPLVFPWRWKRLWFLLFSLWSLASKAALYAHYLSKQKAKTQLNFAFFGCFSLSCKYCQKTDSRLGCLKTATASVDVFSAGGFCHSGLLANKTFLSLLFCYQTPQL